MSILSELFNWGHENESPSWELGRYSDAYKPAASYKLWESSILAFESESFLESVRLLLEFLKDPHKENLKYAEDSGAIYFEFYQGSKTIYGIVKEDSMRAEVKIATAEDYNIGLMRRLLDKNYLLKYSRFTIDDEHNIAMVFDSFTEDASPNKLYKALKEMAIQADKLDDIIIDEFDNLSNIDAMHIIPRDDQIREHQVNYLFKALEQVFTEINEGKLNTDQFPGGLSYLLLSLNYKIDYLLKPEGFLMDIVEHNHRVYFANDGKEIAEKNHEFIQSFRKILERSKKEVKAELYDVISTFGVTTPSTHETLSDFIKAELPNMYWYKQNNHKVIALSIPSYIVGFCLFNYALPQPDIELLQLYYKVIDHEFFNMKGEVSPYINKNRLSSRAIKKEIVHIIEKHLGQFPFMQPDFAIIDFSSKLGFAETYLQMIQNLNLNRS